MVAHLLSIQAGQPAQHGADPISKKSWQSGIFKFPVAGRVYVDTLNIAGDGQADLKNHGGPYRAVLAYAAEHYPVWRAELNRPDFPHGGFGENFTISELNEKNVYIGDVYAIGEVRLQVSQPRMPCWKLARRWGIKDLTARVDAKAQGGWYHRVLQTGYVEAGQEVTLIERVTTRYTVDFLFALMNEWIDDPDELAEVIKLDALTDSWREHFTEKLARA